MDNFIQVETRAGEPFLAGEHTITPFSQVVKVQIPGLPGGFIWNRPVSILARSAAGDEQVIPVPDITRQMLWALWGASLLSVLFMVLFIRNNRKKR